MDPTTHISTVVDDCGRGFLSLADVLKGSNFTSQIRSEEVIDEFDRFKLWAGNIAAHRKGQRSLEYRLRDAAHLKEETLNLLGALQDSLQDAQAIVTGERIPWDEDILSDSDSDTSSDQSSEVGNSDLQGDTELKQIFASIKNSVTCLFRLSIAIRDPAPNTQSQSTITVDKSFFEQHDTMHVQAKYPNCEEYLVQRLGHAISGRRQYLSYREEHHLKLAKSVETIGFEAPRTEHTTNSTEASRSMKQPLSIDDEDTLSQTSFATSINTTIRVPPLPKAARNELFECPFCFMIVSIQTAMAWKQHVYRDLHPYSCTFEHCTTADRLYDSRHVWFKHEVEAHRTSWQCIEGCDKTYSDVDHFHAHVRKIHPDLASASMLSALTRTASKRPNLLEQGKCPLCDKRMALRTLQKHLGHHQEQLALFALPPNLEETEDDAQLEDQGSDVADGQQDEELSDLSDTTSDELLSSVTPKAEPYVSLPVNLREQMLMQMQMDKETGQNLKEKVSESDEQLSSVTPKHPNESIELDHVESSYLTADSEVHREQEKLDIIKEKMRAKIEREGLERDERRRLIEEHTLNMEREEREAKEARKRAVEDYNRKHAKKEEERKAEQERIVAEFEKAQKRRPKDAEQAQKEREQLIMQMKAEEEFRKQNEKEEYERFLRVQKEISEQEKVKKVKAEEELETAMQKRLAQFGFEDNQIQSMVRPEATSKIQRQPTYVKVHRQHLSTDTLHYYDIPYHIDASDPNYIVVTRELVPKETEVLFEHTRRLRSRRPTSKDLETEEPGRAKPDYAFVRRKQRSRSEDRSSEQRVERVKRAVGIKEMFY